MGSVNLKKHLIQQRLFGLLFLTLSLSCLWGFHVSPVAKAVAHGERIPIMFFGTDAADASKHTDTLMVVVLHPLTHLFQALFVPRDTRVKIPGFRFNRINEIYGYHLRKTSDPALAAMEVKKGLEYVLSSEENPISLPYYIQVDYSIFTKIIDIIGGVWVRVKTPMHYDDNAGNYHIHMEPGNYLMNGNDALHYVRYRSLTGDRGRILRQQEFIRSTIKRFANPVNILRFPQLVMAVTSSVRTNLTFWDLVFLTSEARKLRSGRIGFYILPGRPHHAYWYLKKEAAQNLAAALILGKTLIEEGLEPIASQSDRITIKVMNASAHPGLAYRLTKYLRSKGFDVVDWGNYSMKQVPTRVIDRTGNILKAQAVARSLGIQSVHSEPSGKVLVDVEVILGTNYSGVGTIE